jgi:hypothetical protein
VKDHLDHRHIRQLVVLLVCFVPAVSFLAFSYVVVIEVEKEVAVFLLHFPVGLLPLSAGLLPLPTRFLRHPHVQQASGQAQADSPL